MFRTLTIAAVLAAGFGMFASAVCAEEKPKEVTLKGSLVCAKCALNEPGKCANVLQVKDGDKTVNYYLSDKGNGEGYHEGACGGGKVEGVSVTGTVTEKDGKKWVMATKVDAPK